MTAIVQTRQPTFSVRLVRPFIRLLRRDSRIPQESLSELEKLDDDERLPIVAVQQLLDGAIVLTGDQDIGLKAAHEIAPGDYGALEYAARSAATWDDACNAVGRYMGLVNDALRFSLHVEGERVVIQLDSTVTLTRAAADFQSAAFQVAGSRILAIDDFEPEFEAWFTHPAPADTTEYERTFAGGVLRFGAPVNGFATKRVYLERPLPGADPQLHALIRKHAESMLAELPRAETLTERVRDLLSKELASGTPTLTNIARKVSMSERTLARHLDEEGTTFKALLEDLRHRLALRYVRNSELPFSEIAFLLGFSQAAAFHRAFRRWTQQTPLEYRQAPLPNR